MSTTEQNHTPLATTVPAWTLGDRIRKARKSAGLSAGELAELLEVHEATIRRWESDSNAPSGPTIAYMAMRCGVPTWWLKGDEPRSTIW